MKKKLGRYSDKYLISITHTCKDFLSNFWVYISCMECILDVIPVISLLESLSSLLDREYKMKYYLIYLKDYNTSDQRDCKMASHKMGTWSTLMQVHLPLASRKIWHIRLEDRMQCHCAWMSMNSKFSPCSILFIKCQRFEHGLLTYLFQVQTCGQQIDPWHHSSPLVTVLWSW